MLFTAAMTVFGKALRALGLRRPPLPSIRAPYAWPSHAEAQRHAAAAVRVMYATEVPMIPLCMVTCEACGVAYPAIADTCICGDRRAPPTTRKATTPRPVVRAATDLTDVVFNAIAALPPTH